MTSKERFISIFNKNITRKGADDLLRWLETTDFFTAPASTKYHGAHNGGLCEHSLNVYRLFHAEMEQMTKLFSGETLTPEIEESMAICALLHDVCKVNFYKTSTKNQKNEKGEWEKVPFYTVDDLFPFGHGEKSVFLIERFLRLKEGEAIAIRWHMGGFDDAVKGGSYSVGKAFEKFKPALLLHIADMKATYLLEN